MADQDRPDHDPRPLFLGPGEKPPETGREVVTWVVDTDHPLLVRFFRHDIAAFLRFPNNIDLHALKRADLILKRQAVGAISIVDGPNRYLPGYSSCVSLGLLLRGEVVADLAWGAGRCPPGCVRGRVIDPNDPTSQVILAPRGPCSTHATVYTTTTSLEDP